MLKRIIEEELTEILSLDLENSLHLQAVFIVVFNI